MSGYIKAKFEGFCPNCGGEIEAERLAKRLACSGCLPEEVDPEQLCSALFRTASLAGMRRYCFLQEEVKRFCRFFESRLGFPPWSLQVSWAKRVLLGRSFAMVAPTGVGKTTFALAMAAFWEGKSYIVVPTKLLVEQAAARLSGITDKKVLAYSGEGKEREELKERIKQGDFDILITTNAFLNRNFDELLKGKTFDLIFVDDVDAVLKASRNIDYLFHLIGASERAIKLAAKVVLSDEEKEVLEREKAKIKGRLIVSTATAKPKTSRINLFSRLLGFEVQRSPSTLRNIVDVLEEVEGEYEQVLERAAELASAFGRGGLVFLPADRGREWVERAVEVLEKAGIKAVSYEKFDAEAQEDFCQGKIKVVVGISHSHNPLVRGVDLPHAIRYAIFAGVPKMVFPVQLSLKPSHLFSLLLSLRPIMEEKEKVDAYILKLRSYLNLSEQDLERYPRIKSFLQEVLDFLNSFISKPGFREKVEASDEIGLREEDGNFYIVVADAASYIQASGRTSRLFPGGISQGLSYLLVDEPKARNSLLRRLRLLNPDIEFRKPGEVNFAELLAKIDQDRQAILQVRQVGARAALRDIIKTAVIAVESPTKAKTIAGFFGKPTRKWVQGVPVYEINTGEKIVNIIATLGHVTDLVVFKGLYGVEREDGTLCPIYATIKKCRDGSNVTDQDCPDGVEYDKMSIISALRELALECDEVYIATDPDSEGEKISWDLYVALRPFNPNIRRAEFHEITRRAFLHALSSWREVNLNLVRAQITRRIADRWVGFALSQQVQQRFRNRHLSAGRVQSPVLGWVIEREQERKKKKALLTLKFNEKTLTLEIEDLKLARRIAEEVEEVEVKIKERFERELSPPPPFTTDALIAESSEKLHLPASRTMQLAQELFEKGLITYHRTDSTRVSDAGMRVASDYIQENFGREFLQLRSWKAEGAHECIRPTRPVDRDSLRFLVSQGIYELEGGRDALRLYDLIFRRFMASQMKKCRVKGVKAEVKAGEHSQEFEFITGIVEHGYDMVLPVRTEQIEEGLFPVQEKQLKVVPSVLPYSQGKLIEEMKRRGIGRPSTYAKIVSTLLERGYVVDRRNFLYPTKLGFMVYSFLKQRYPLYCDEEFTRLLEEEMDRVEEGKRSVEEVIEKILASGNLDLRPFKRQG